MRKTALLLASIAVAVALAGGAALAANSEAGNPNNAEARDALLDASLKALVARGGGPPGAIAVAHVKFGRPNRPRVSGPAGRERRRGLRAVESVG